MKLEPTTTRVLVLLRTGWLLVAIAAGAATSELAYAIPVAVAPRSPAPQREWTWRLAGLTIGPQRREALFARGAETRTVSEGEEIDGWKVSAVNATSVQLTGPDGERTLSPQRDATAAAAAAINERIRADQRDRKRAAQRTETAMQQLTKAMMDSQTTATSHSQR